MAHTRRTLALSRKWDLELSAAGLIRVVRGDYATAQNVAGECRLFTEDGYFIQDKGIPHFMVELGQDRELSDSLLRFHLRRAALRVEDIAEVLAVSVESFDRESRTLSASVQASTFEGARDGELRITI